MSGRDVRVVELFAGVGGFRIGLERASNSFKTIWANQWEPGRKNQFAFDCYNYHFSNSGSVNVNDDIEKVKNLVPDHDLLVGGFPCQDYSVASSNSKGIIGKKGVLWWSIYDIILSKRPKYILLENVDRLVKSPVRKRGRDFGIILRCLADGGYDVEWRIINAEEYGLQQRRRRIFIFACRDDLKCADVYKNEYFEDVVKKHGFFAKSFPITGMPQQDKLNKFSVGVDKYPSVLDVSNDFEGVFYRAGAMVGGEVYTREVKSKSPKKCTTLGDLLQECVDEKYYQDDKIEKWKYMKGSKRLVRKREDGSESVYSEGAIPFPDILDRPGRTMLTSEGTVNRSSHIVLDPHTNRYRTLTPVECERLNGFPDGWTDTGMSDSQRYFTMGNALVVQLIEKMGERIESIDSTGHF